MHPLRVLLIVSLVVAVAVAWGFGAALDRAGAAPAESVILGLVVFVLFLVPWAGVTWWAIRRASDLDEMIERARAAAEGQMERPLTERPYHAELDELARAVDEIRSASVRQASAHEEHRAAMDQIVASLGEGLLAVNREERVVFVNPRVREMFGSSGEVAGRSLLEVVRKRTVVAAVEQALAGAVATDRVTYGSGVDEHEYEIRAFPVRASPEIAAVALFIDITAIERLQRIRREFLDDFSHEVRTPLAGLRSAAETLERPGVPEEQERQLRQVMYRQIARIERLVSDLSELNQIESGEIVLLRVPTPLHALLADLTGDLAGRMSDVRFELTGEATALVDSMRAQQIFANLLENAGTHGGAGRIEIAISREGDEAVVSVSDQGPGIPPAEIERIFNRFYRIDRSRSRPGTGLGLAITRHLVAAHGGTIRALNRAGGGATFEVRLPAA